MVSYGAFNVIWSLVKRYYNYSYHPRCYTEHWLLVASWIHLAHFALRKYTNGRFKFGKSAAYHWYQSFKLFRGYETGALLRYRWRSSFTTFSLRLLTRESERSYRGREKQTNPKQQEQQNSSLIDFSQQSDFERKRLFWYGFQYNNPIYEIPASCWM